ncbi:uncharacterized protein MJAP1_003812 [Malassezia japonica]|uniref:Hepatocellular carcinoma-associated antigen 59 n=1 Tax=Malassezia japonica TaxID=223818 RepID=A0AAF0F9G3_9BASI|nr:uncharacterized protein MJAP1_003812 [Malassezia japonica]WFD40823.1 hypothetical protein MJAP1_003812 [Malassezia japonica]
MQPDGGEPAEASPVFKKRGHRGKVTKISATALPDDAADNASPDDGEKSASPAVDELVTLRNLLRKPTGIELSQLNQGDTKKKGGEQGTAAGGDAHANAIHKLVHKDHFQGETRAMDVDKHMMDYVESEMRKRKLGDGGDMSKEGLQKRMVDPADELFQVAEKYRKLQREAQSELPSQTSRPSAEGHSTLSAAMLSKVPEIDLGISARLQNIEATEKAKRELYEKRQIFRANARTPSARDEAALLRDARREAHGEPIPPRPEPRPRHEQASDDRVLGRFKKRQRSFR